MRLNWYEIKSVQWTWEEFKYVMTHCDECDCEYEHPKEGCQCECHGDED